MKRKNIEVLLLSLSFVSCSSLEYGQVQKIEVDLMTVHAVLTVPKPIKIHREQYEEGVVYALSFLKGEVILVCEGSLMQFSVDQYKTLQMKKNSNVVVAEGKNGEKCWRNDAYPKFKICYDNVSRRNKKMFDAILNNVKYHIE